MALDIHSVLCKFHKIARTCRWLHRNLAERLPSHRSYVLDEEETFEKASIKPLTMPVLIERDSYFVVAVTAGPIRRLAAEGTARRRVQDAVERRHGRRRDRSRRCVEAVLGELRRRIGATPLRLTTDEKPTYARLIRRIFGRAAQHETTSSTMVRATFNPLFPINHTLTMTRDNCGRLRHRSWLVTEKVRYLRRHMQVFTAYRNYVRRRHNFDKPSDTPAVLLGLIDRPLRSAQVLGWRQDWESRSVHPACRSGLATVA